MEAQAPQILYISEIEWGQEMAFHLFVFFAYKELQCLHCSNLCPRWHFKVKVTKLVDSARVLLGHIVNK